MQVATDLLALASDGKSSSSSMGQSATQASYALASVAPSVVATALVAPALAAAALASAAPALVAMASAAPALADAASVSMTMGLRSAMPTLALRFFEQQRHSPALGVERFARECKLEKELLEDTVAVLETGFWQRRFVMVTFDQLPGAGSLTTIIMNTSILMPTTDT